MVRPAALRLPRGRSSCFESCMTRISVYIDGYNLYHAIHDTKQPHLKWLSLRELSKLLTHSISDASIREINYFSAYATWKADAYKRHRDYVAALKAENCNIILGKFKKNPAHCNKCGHSWFKHEEKETDVNLALKLLNDAHTDIYDHALVISADTDLAPAIRLVQEQFPHKNVTAVFPPGRHHVAALSNAASADIRISTKMLARCLLPQTLSFDGKTILRPNTYKN